MAISESIRAEMKRKEINVIELSHKVGYSPHYLTALLYGRRRWNETVLSKVCQALNLQLEIKPADDTIPRAAGE